MRRLCGFLAVLVAACGGAEAPLHGGVIDPPQEAPVVRAQRADGSVMDLDRERGQRLVMLFFGYTYCPDVCPTTLADWAKARQQLGRDASAVRWVFVSVDPARDTPDVAERYARQFDSTFVGLAPNAAQLDSLKAAWTFDVRKETTPEMKPGVYAVAHPAGSFVIDKQGRVREILPPNSRAEDIAADLRRLK
jgi:protein SCO1/2